MNMTISTEQTSVLSMIFDSLHTKKEQCLLVVTGGAGTGKSRMVEWIRVLIEHVLHLRLEITATTGTAASLISGITVHRALSIV